MSGIPSDLNNRLLVILLDCGPFASDNELRAIFVDARINPWRNRTLEANNPTSRVQVLIDTLHNQYNSSGQNVLALFLYVLSEQRHPEDACHQRLVRLATELEREMVSPEIERVEAAIEREQSRNVGLKTDAVAEAQKLIAEAKQYLKKEETVNLAAPLLADAAVRLAEAKEINQARNYATQAAELYLKGDDKLAAARQYLHAVELWLYHRTSPELARRQLEEATKLVDDLDDPVLRSQLLIIRAWYAFATMDDTTTQNYWDQIQAVLPQLEDDAQKAQLGRTAALQQATFAMVWEKWDLAQEILQTALEAVPVSARDERLDLFQGLLLVNTERGAWETADRLYQEAQSLLESQGDPQRLGLLTMHYAASLARRNKLQEAYEHYLSALQHLEGHVDVYTLGLGYQNMNYMLMRNGVLLFPDFDQHQARRVDLFYGTQTENKGHQHEVRALEMLVEEKLRDVLQQARLALVHYWQEGNWPGIENTYKLLAKFHAVRNNPVEALKATIRASDHKAAVEYGEVLEDKGDREQLDEIAEFLIQTRPAACEQVAATKALETLADVIPPRLLTPTLEHLLGLLRKPETEGLFTQVRRYSAEALRKFIAQLSYEQTNKVVQATLDQLQSPQNWTITEALLNLLNECFVQKPPKVELSLYAPVTEALLNFQDDEHLRRLAERAAGHLARTAPPEVREVIVTYLKAHSNQIERLAYLTVLKEQIPEDQLGDTIDQILQAINPQPFSIGHATAISISAISPRALINFKDVLSVSRYDQIIDGLLAAIINDENLLHTRSNAIWALSELPADALQQRADEVAKYLMWGAEEDTLPRSETINRELESQTDPLSNFRNNFGNNAEIRRSSLRALGRLYMHLSPENQKQVSDLFITARRDRDPTVRQGVAMALGASEGHLEEQNRLLLALVVLLQDSEPKPCAWAGVATGHFIKTGLAEPFAEDMVESLIHLAETSSNVEVRVGAAIGLRLATSSERLDEAMHRRAVDGLKKLADDVSFKVRREATTNIANGSDKK